jgi:predicted PurR-regulated permease PerM
MPDRDDAEKAQESDEAREGESLARPHELLIHPDDQPGPGDSDPFGSPGRPMSRRSPFYMGFFGGLGVLLALVLGMAVQRAQSVLVLILVAVFLAVGLNPIVEVLIHRGIRRRWSVLIVSLGVLSFMALFVVALVPVLRDQITALIDNAPGWLDQLSKNRTVQDLDRKYEILNKIRDKLQDPALAQQAFGSIFTVGLALLNGLLNAFLIFVLTLYFLSALPEIKRACYSLAPKSRRERVTSLGDEILRRVGGYVAGAFVIAVIAGVTSFIFLEIAGLGQYALALALVVAILDFIPLIGATIGAFIVSVIGFATSPTIGIACVIFYIVYQQVENYVIYPRVMRSSLNVPGIVTVVAVLIGGSLLGVVGALLAIPTAAAAILLLREVYLRNQEAS